MTGLDQVRQDRDLYRKDLIQAKVLGYNRGMNFRLDLIVILEVVIPELDNQPYVCHPVKLVIRKVNSLRGAGGPQDVVAEEGQENKIIGKKNV